MDNDVINKLKQWVKDNYHQHSTGWTPERSMGNYDDCFYDGAEYGTSWAAYEIGCILGMKLKEPEVNEDESKSYFIQR